MRQGSAQSPVPLVARISRRACPFRKMKSMARQEVFVGLADGQEGHLLGAVWKLTGKKTDFYIEPLGAGRQNPVHISAHGPNERFSGHRFHIKVDREARLEQRRQQGLLVEHGIPASGVPFDGHQIQDGVFLVARLRWMPILQDESFRSVALYPEAVPSTDEPHQSGHRLNSRLAADKAWDLDLLVSYERPYWPHGERTAADDARLPALETGRACS